jgi:hypothetical protein
MWVQEIEGPQGPLRLAWGEFSNCIWGVYVPEAP